MTSQRRIEANRSNARKSTGPRTREGKARSCQNGRKHGFRSAQPWSPSPADHPELAALLHALRLDIRPQNAAEDLCCLQIATAVFQMRLLDQAEIEALAPHVDHPATLLRKGYTFARYRSRPECLFYEALHRLDRLRTREFARPNPIPAAAQPCAPRPLQRPLRHSGTRIGK